MLYTCTHCNYKSNNKSNYSRHLNTNKHKKNDSIPSYESEDEYKPFLTIIDNDGDEPVTTVVYMM